MVPPTDYEMTLLRVMNLFDSENSKTMESAIHDALVHTNAHTPPDVRLREVNKICLRQDGLSAQMGME